MGLLDSGNMHTASRVPAMSQQHLFEEISREQAAVQAGDGLGLGDQSGKQC